jgi:hypothetical protein
MELASHMTGRISDIKSIFVRDIQSAAPKGTLSRPMEHLQSATQYVTLLISHMVFRLVHTKLLCIG